MKLGIYVIFDKVAEQAGPLFQAKNDGVAMRMVSVMKAQKQIVNDDDYSLLFLGKYDDELCEVEGKEVRVVNVSMSLTEDESDTV